jgi:dihydrofolate synthase/folylpolyglutamate synthase
VVREQPRIILDGAHNPDAAENLVRFLDAEFLGGDLLVIFGAMRDKDFLTFGHLLFPRARRVFLARSKNSRSAEVDTLVAAFRPDFPEKMIGSTSLAQALEEAVSLARPESWIVVTGSLYLVGEAMRILNLDPLAPAR